MTSARALISRLEDIADPAAAAEVRRFYRGGDPATRVMGVPIGRIFPVAKQFTALPLSEVKALLDDPRYEVRMAAVSVMDFKARQKKLPEAERRALFELYLRRHDRIDNWDLVDRAAPHVVDEFLVDRDRSVLERLARSGNPHERRTAIVATHAFLRRDETAETFRLAEVLAGDRDEYVQKAITSWVREAGKRAPGALADFLARNAERLPRPTLTAASKLLPEEVRLRLRG